MNKNQFKFFVIDKLKTSKVMLPVYNKLKKIKSGPGFSLDNCRPLNYKVDYNDNMRINLVLPTLRKTKVFGGINTALKFYNLLLNTCRCQGRIIVLNDEKADVKWQYPVENFSRESEEKQIVYLADFEEVNVRKNDIFFFTSWRTEYSFSNLIDWHKNTYGMENYKAIYFIQDFEPGFFPWSSEYVIADSTYRKNANSLIAIFNSEELFTFFKNNKYSFAEELFFTPSLNDSLKKILLDNNKEEKRQKKILIYGRPSEHRNAYEVVRYSLQEWTKLYPKASEWKIVSLGENYENVALTNNVIEVKGKVSLDEYASEMLSAYAGISLMVSPHPSYPPLEMSTFGVRTITNTFENKDLSMFNENIISIQDCSPSTIIERLTSICEEYDSTKSNISMNKTYIDDNSILLAVNKAGEIINGIYNKTN